MFPRSYAALRPAIVPAGLAALFGGGWLVWSVVGLDAALVLAAGVCGAALMGVIGFRYPLVAVALTVALGQMLDRDLTEIEGLGFPTVGSLTLRYFDPVLLGLSLALVLRLLAGDRRLERFLGAAFATWTIYVGWIVLQMLRTVGTYGPVAALGEFRTYYQYLLLVPFVVVSFRTEAAQWRLFRLLLVAGFLFVPLALLRGGLDFGFQIGPRWFNASSNFALLTAVVSLFIATRLRSIRMRDRDVAALSILFAFVTLVNTHRSVWLATAVAIVLLVLLRIIPFRRYLQLGVAGVVAALGAGLLFSSAGGSDAGLGDYLALRLRAFTDPQSDPTASWRSYLWLQIIESIRQHPWLGMGLGNNFQLTGPDGKLWMTSPHNYYLMVGYHAGLPGIALYLLFVLQAAGRLLTGWGRAPSVRQRTMLLSTLVIVAAGHALLVAYPHEFFMLLYLGLGASVVVSLATESRAERRSPGAAADAEPAPAVTPPPRRDTARR